MKSKIFICGFTFLIGIKIIAQNLHSSINANSISQLQIQNVNYFDAVGCDIFLIQQQFNVSVQKNGLGTFSSQEKSNKLCNDCEEVRIAVKAAKKSSGFPGSFYRKRRARKEWRKFVHNFNLKMKKIFSRIYKTRTPYSVCFKWQ